MLPTEHPLFVCAKMQITEGCPNYFKTELTAEAESQIKKFANSVFRGDVRFYSRFFDNENIFDTNAAQLRSIIPNVPCVMSFSKVTSRTVFFHYHLWGSRSAEILHGHFDVELPWRDVAQQLRNQSEGAVLDEDDLHETIGDWLTTLQKIYAVFFIDLYALVDGDNPFYATKLDSVNVGLPNDLAGQYIQPLMEILQRVQRERIEAFNEELHRQQDEEERKRQEALRCQREDSERMRQEELQRQREQELRQELMRQRLLSFPSAEGMQPEYRKLNKLLLAQEWYKANNLTQQIMLKLAHKEIAWLTVYDINNYPCEDLQTIDDLWVYHSKGKFGFTVQKELWMKCHRNVEIFCITSGMYSCLTPEFPLASFPRWHSQKRSDGRGLVRELDGLWYGVYAEINLFYSSLFSRLETCGL